MDNKNQKEDDSSRMFEKEGIFIENDRTQEENIGAEKLNTEDIKKELLNSIDIDDIEFKKTVEVEGTLNTVEIRKELNEGGIEILPNEPLDDDMTH